MTPNPMMALDFLRRVRRATTGAIEYDDKLTFLRQTVDENGKTWRENVGIRLRQATMLRGLESALRAYDDWSAYYAANIPKTYAELEADFDAKRKWMRDHLAEDDELDDYARGRRADREFAEPSKCRDDDIATLRMCFVDIDPPKPADGVWTDETFAAARAQVAEIAKRVAALPCPPSVVVDSGGGAQCLWLLDPVPATDESRAAFEQVERGLLVAIPEADKPVRDPSRILRLPGTVNAKPGRPARLARVVEGLSPFAPASGLWRRYSLTELGQAFPPPTDTEWRQMARKPGRRRGGAPSDWRPVDDAEFRAAALELKATAARHDLLAHLEERRDALGDVWRNGPDAASYRPKDTSGSTKRLVLAGLMLAAGFTWPDFYLACRSWEHATGSNELTFERMYSAWAFVYAEDRDATHFDVVDEE